MYKYKLIIIEIIRREIISKYRIIGILIIVIEIMIVIMSTLTRLTS